ncbi:SCO family protein [Rhodopila sp.]|uniref:SCO family protein n=1 Tax=Rhodopila sp. TaxID=2480087 RepID=UPI002C1F8914|nr:SCO family protein [Rhodopila sp.]HVZ10297.1 SCO family protein [Rhodopila sp.]
MRRAAWLALLGLCLVLPAHAASLAAFGFTQRQGAALPLDALFQDADGRRDTLGDFLARRPVILALGYFHCPNLCGVVRADLMEALRSSGLAAGRDYTLLAISIDPSETAADAANAKAEDRARFNPDHAGEAWHYLVGTQAGINAVQRAVGYHSRFDSRLKQFLHPAGLVIGTPDGRVSGYLLGVGYSGGDLNAAVMRAAGGATARALPVLLLCFHYDPATGRYSLAIMKVLRLAGLLTVLVLGGVILLVHRGARP